MSTAPKVLERTTFQTSRLLEFCSRKELTAQTGHEPELWPLVIVRELLDNSLDAAEEAGIAPEIRIKLTRRSIAVVDNGPGLPAETIVKILDFTTRTSSREAYVSPSRGQQGNALKTVLAMPFALGGGVGRVGITSHGMRHKMTFTVDPIRQAPVIEHRQHPVGSVRNGTRVTVAWPVSAGSDLEDARADILRIVRGYALFNPHARLTVVGHDPHLPSTPGWAKWLPSDPTSPHWYGHEQFERLIAAYLRHDQDHGRERTVREFVSEFRGLSGSAKLKAVLEITGLARAPLSRLLNGGGAFDRQLVDTLRQAMIANSRPVKPEDLGIVGETHLRAQFTAAACELETFRYKMAKGTTQDGVPWVAEAAFAWRPCAAAARTLISGVNWAASIGNPFRSLRGWQSLDSVLGDSFAGPGEPVMIALHFACARPQFTDRGKSALVLDRTTADAVINLVTHVTAAWKKQRKAEMRDRSRALNRRDSLAQARKVSIKDAAWRVMRSAYLKASASGKLPANARQIMYAARPDILRMTRRDSLDANYFIQTLLPDYVSEHPEETANWDVVYDARGSFAEPHTDETVSLGTIDVRRYLSSVGYHQNPRESIEREAGGGGELFPTRGPQNRYGAILFIEKEGFGPLLKAARIAERYDIAIMSTKGLSVTASRLLVDQLCATHQLPLLVLHDFDKSGFSIIGTLRRSTRRYTFRNSFNVVDLGIRMADVEEYDLQCEPCNDVGSGDVDTLRLNGATAEEIAFLREQRVELNAFTSDQLIEWIELKLERCAVAKVVPTDEVLELEYRRVVAARYFERHANELIEAARAHAANEDIPADLRLTVERALAEERAQPWDHAIRTLVR